MTDPNTTKPINEKSAEKRMKKLLFLTKVIFGFLLICMILLFDYLDYSDLKSKNEQLGLLRKLSLVSPASLEAVELEPAVVAWVEKNAKPTADAYVNARKSISGLLLQQGISERQVSEAKGYTNEAENKFLTIGFTRNQPLPERLTGISREQLPIEDMLEVMRYYAQPLTVQVLTKADTGQLKARMLAAAAGHDQKEKSSRFATSYPYSVAVRSNDHMAVDVAEEIIDPSGDIIINEAPDVIREEREVQPTAIPVRGEETKPDLMAVFKRHYDFKSVKLVQDSVVMFYAENRGVGQYTSNREGSQLGFAGAAGITTLKTPSVLALAGMDTARINALYHDTLLQQNISAQYGKLSVSEVNTFYSKLLDKNTKSISILGIDISRRWFPLALLVLVVIVNLLLLLNTAKVKAVGAFPPADFDSDDALDWLLVNRLARALLWILPPLLIAGTIGYTAFIRYPTAYYVLLATLAVLASVLGALAFLRSVKR